MKCKVLHIRSSGDTLKRFEYDQEELREFVEWVLGSDGLPDLELVAFGDFSHQGLYMDHNRLFRRVSSAASSSGVPRSVSIQEVPPRLPRGQRLTNYWADALESCAFRRIDSESDLE